MTSKFQHVKLINLFRPGTVDRVTSSDVNKFPVADQLMHRSTGPMVCSTQFSRCGRWVGRIRYPYRSSRQAKPLTKTVCLNTQGLNWRLIAHAHKLRSLIQTARERKWTITMLSELHFCEEDRRYPEDCRPQVVCIEEFALLQWCKVGFLLDCPTRMRWEEGGRKFQTASNRIFGIQLSNDQELYTWVSIYAPVQSERAERKTFFDQLDGYLKTVPHERLCIGGDWNGHMGNDTVQHGLPVRTTSGGLEVQQFLAQHHFLQVADQSKIGALGATP